MTEASPSSAGTAAYPADTIVAPATPAGKGGVAVIRLSGDRAVSIARRIAGALPDPRKTSLRMFRDSTGTALDSGMVIYFPGPASFTGEDVVEFHAHGGPVVVSSIVDAILACGARRADPGEFSKRAFLNDKLDLAQAEAIADLIDSGTRHAAAAALRSLSGAFSSVVSDLADELLDLRTYVEAAIDFPEEEIDFLDDRELDDRVSHCEKTIAAVLRAADSGRLLRDGFQIVIVGRPNAGKSSLLNALSGEDAAIVTEVAGTTRDIVRERINLDGLAVELIDTAGLRDDPDRIEAEGIRRARAAIESADAVLWLIDAADDLSDPAGGPELPEGIPRLIVRNKIDLTGEPPGEAAGHIGISALTGEGLDALRDAIRALAGYTGVSEGSFTARQRHVDALRRAELHFFAGTEALRRDRAGELFAEELRLALEALGEITGAVTSDALLGRIFSSFCIGK